MSPRLERATTYTVLVAFSIASVAPVIGIFLLALNPPDELVTGLGIPDAPSFENFPRAFSKANFATYLRSSAIVLVAVVSVSTLLSILTGYAFGTMRFRGSSVLFYVLLFGLFVPFEVMIVPLYYDLRQFGLTNTYWALILPQIGSAMSFGTFWMRAYFRSAPRTLVEAARMDGASSWRILWRVLVPGGRPAIMTLVALLSMWTWNEFMLALVMISDPDMRTAPLGLALFADQRTTDLPGLAAGATMVALPVLLIYIFLQRHFIRGMFSGGIKE